MPAGGLAEIVQTGFQPGEDGSAQLQALTLEVGESDSLELPVNCADGDRVVVFVLDSNKMSPLCEMHEQTIIVCSKQKGRTGQQSKKTDLSGHVVCEFLSRDISET